MAAMLSLHVRRLPFLILGLLLAQWSWIAEVQAQLYKEASPELNKRAEQRLRSLFAARSEQGTSQLFASKFLICGPFLWRNIQTAKELQKASSVESLFLSTRPSASGELALDDHGKGRMFNSRGGVDAFRRAFLAKFPADRKATIRKLRLAEIRLFLATIPFPAEEPLFAIESKNHKFIVNLDKDLQIHWIDDYLHLR